MWNSHTHWVTQCQSVSSSMKDDCVNNSLDMLFITESDDLGAHKLLKLLRCVIELINKETWLFMFDLEDKD